MFYELIPFLKGTDKKRIFGGLGLLIAGKGLNIQVPYIFKHLVDGFEGDLNLLTGTGTLLLGYSAARIGAVALGEIKNVIFTRLTQETQKRVAVQVFEHLHRLDHEFHNHKNTGALAKSIDRGLKGISFMSTALIFNVVPTAIEIALVSGLLTVQFGGAYGLAAAGTMGLYTLFTLQTTKWRSKFREHMNKAENSASSLAFDSLLHHETVKQFTNEKYEVEQYSDALGKYEEAARYNSSSLAFLNIGQQAIISGGLFAVMWMTTQGIAAGTATIGDLVLVNGLIFQLSLPLSFLGSIYRELRQASVDVQSLLHLLTIKPNITSSGENVLDGRVEGRIEFKNVSFGYGDRRVLNRLSFVVEPGEFVALVGPSGSGKSTISKLLYRFVDPNEGSISIDGFDISTVDLHSLRRNIGIVPQDSGLFNRSVKYNISYGNPDASLQQIQKVAEESQISTQINNLPSKYDSIVGERGVLFSGGEKQRISIARLLLKNAPIQIFDEATSSLDSLTESLIVNQILSHKKSKTLIVIAHRLETIKNADRILVLSNGSIVETGDHLTLLSQKGLYHDLYQKSISHN